MLFSRNLPLAPLNASLGTSLQTRTSAATTECDSPIPEQPRVTLKTFALQGFRPTDRRSFLFASFLWSRSLFQIRFLSGTGCTTFRPNVYSNRADSLFAEKCSQKNSASVGANDQPTRPITTPVVKLVPRFSSTDLTSIRQNF